jgi:ribonuclease R
LKQRENISEADVRAAVEAARSPVSLGELARKLGVRGKDRKRLRKLIANLKRRNEIEEQRSGRFVSPGKAGAAHTGKPPLEGEAKRPARHGGRERDAVSGRIVTHRDGYGFLVPDQPIAGVEGDLFIPPSALGDAMHGDRVEGRVEKRRADGRAEGRVTRVLRRAHPTVVGIFRYGARGNTVEPFDTRIQQAIVIPPGDELTPDLASRHGIPGARGGGRLRRIEELDGAVVNVELTRFPRGGATAAGRVVELLGRPGDFGLDVEIIIRKHHLPFVFPEEVLAEARAFPGEVPEGDLAGRRDFRALPIVTIDGETAKDFDDAVYVEQLADGWRLHVHIADVAHYVRPGTALDREARLRGTSVYFPDRAVPMLPEELSNHLCSLRPKEDRLVMSVLMEFDAEGRMRGAEFGPGVIRSAERMTYTSVYRVLEGDAEMLRRYEAHAEHFRRMRALAELLNRQRERRGSIDFDLPEAIVEFDELGRMTGIVRSERNVAHRIIEEFMLAANHAVARQLEEQGLASLHRVHEKPDPRKVLEFEQLARAFGYSLGVADLSEKQLTVKHGSLRAPSRAGRGRRGGRERPMTVALPGALEMDIRPQHYQKLVEKIAGRPEERILSYLMLRSLKQARYAAEPLGHFALAMDQYTHFTSPIRRYPDLIVHRVLKWHLENQTKAKKNGEGLGPYSRVVLEEVAAESSEAERRAQGAERELMDWKTAQFMETRLGEEFDAIVISIVKFGFFVELIEVFVEGMVPVETLESQTGERWFYREPDRVLLSEKKKKVRLGDRLRVRADRVDPLRKRVEFSPVTLPR